MRFDPKKKSKKQEKRIAREVGGKQTPGSGSRWNAKGDVKTSSLLIEAKTTTHRSFSVTSTILDKISEEAVLCGRTPVLSVEITSGIRPKRYAVLAWEDFLALSGESE